MNNKSAAAWLEQLALQPHPEGGFYREIYVAARSVQLSDVPAKTYRAGSTILYLLGSPSVGQFSAWHYLVDIDEVWHYHLGSTLQLIWIDAEQRLQTRSLGIEIGAELQVMVPANCWFAAAVVDNAPEAFTLVSCSCFPGFNYANFQLAQRVALTAKYPQHAAIIKQYTRN